MIRISKAKELELKRLALMAEEYSSALFSVVKDAERIIGGIFGDEEAFEHQFRAVEKVDASSCGELWLPINYKITNKPDCFGEEKAIDNYLYYGKFSRPTDVADGKPGQEFYLQDMGAVNKTEFLSILIEDLIEKYGVKPFDYYSTEFRKMRHQVFLRDGEICAKCGFTPSAGSENWLEVDHIKPVSKFPELGLDIDNLQVLCKKCNREKSNKNCKDYRGGE